MIYNLQLLSYLNGVACCSDFNSLLVSVKAAELLNTRNRLSKTILDQSGAAAYERLSLVKIKIPINTYLCSLKPVRFRSYAKQVGGQFVLFLKHLDDVSTIRSLVVIVQGERFRRVGAQLINLLKDCYIIKLKL